MANIPNENIEKNIERNSERENNRDSARNIERNSARTGNIDRNSTRSNSRTSNRDRSGERPRNTRPAKSESGVPVWVHAIIISVIIGVVAFSIYRLWLWNKGTAETEGVVEGDFSVEVMDQIFLMPEDKKALQADDGVETILFMGNDILTYYADENGVVEKIGSKLGANTINVGFPQSTVALKNASYDSSYPLDAFSFYSVSKAITTGDFSQMESAAENLENGYYTLHTQALSAVDMSKVDTLVVFYDAQDYISLRIGMNPDNDSDPQTYSGALNAGIKLIQEKFPHIRIVCMSFPMCYAYDNSGALVSGDMYDFGNGRLTTYMQFMIDVSGATGVSFVDNYYGTIHEDNSSEWLLDNIHVNAACNEHMAQHFKDAIYPEN